MKFLSTSSSSATTSTATTFDENMCSSKNAVEGCLTGVLRRLLCFNSLPTHPSDHIKETDGNECVECDKFQYSKSEHRVEADASATPGVVARLMGLNSMPRFDSSNTQNLISPNSIARSRSMNSVDSWGEFGSMQGKENVRAKSSLSFREPPTFLELDEFFILCFENGSEIKELGSKSGKPEMVFAEVKQRKAEKRRNKKKTRERVREMDKENLEPNNVSIVDSSNILCPTKTSQENSSLSAMEGVKQYEPINYKQKCVRRRSRRKKREKSSPVKKAETCSDSEDASPVSVLDFVKYPIDLEVHSSEEDSRFKGSNSSRKLPEKLESNNLSSPCDAANDSVIDDCESKTIVASRKKNCRSENYADMWEEICTLVEPNML